MAMVNTVLGPVAPDALGITAVHEHIFYGLMGWERDPQVNFSRPAAFEKIQGEMSAFKDAGGGTILDCSAVALGRDIEFYQDLSRETGVHVVACTGFGEERTIPGHYFPPAIVVPGIFEARDVTYFEEFFTAEVNLGMMLRRLGRSKVKAGFIKVASSTMGITPLEEVIERGAARAADRTGAALSIRGAQFAERHLELIQSEGLAPERVIISHCDEHLDLERDLNVARQGAYVAYSNIGTEDGTRDDERVQLIKGMVDAGYAHRLVLSCNAVGYPLGWPQLSGSYAHLLRGFVPLLRATGISEEVVHTMLVENPKQVLAIP